MQNRRWGRPAKLTPRQILEKGHAWNSFVAAAHDKPGPAPLAPKREIRRGDGKPLTPTEHQEQAAVISWWYTAHSLYRLPLFALFACPNGGARDVITGSLLKAEGVRPGTPDLILPAPTPAFSGLFIEMKRVGGAKPTPEQVAFRDYLLAAGYWASVNYGAASAIEEIEHYLADRKP